MSFEYHRIFAALDGTDAQLTVAERALTLARENGAHLRFGHVVDAVPAEASVTDYERLCEESKLRMEEKLASVLTEAHEAREIPEAELVVMAGPVVDVLDRDLISPFEPDLVICGARGLSKIAYAFIGSVSTHLVRTQKCDVLVVK
ncbi:universal stress protein [Cryptobacterium curtum]|uniref:universal stress protein n=1 Tax=Cryptobacterium curtum TaxID=84163 RepID=UPI002357B4D4|nr:universal stress protein [Cryptobacterium curtum]